MLYIYWGKDRYRHIYIIYTVRLGALDIGIEQKGRPQVNDIGSLCVEYVQV